MTGGDNEWAYRRRLHEMAVQEPDADKRALYRCYVVAALSGDPSTHNGAVVLDCHGNYIAQGWNDFTLGVVPVEGMLERPEKYLWIEHAERAALYNAHAMSRRAPHTMYCPWASCADCARAIAMSGVKKLVRLKSAMEHGRVNGGDRWQHSVDVGDAIMRAAGVEIVEWDGVLGVRAWMNGEVVRL